MKYAAEFVFVLYEIDKVDDDATSAREVAREKPARRVVYFIDFLGDMLRQDTELIALSSSATKHHLHMAFHSIRSLCK